MKAARQQIRKAEKAQSKRTADIGCTGTKKSTKKTGGRCYKSAGEALKTQIAFNLCGVVFLCVVIIKVNSGHVLCYLQRS